MIRHDDFLRLATLALLFAAPAALAGCSIQVGGDQGCTVSGQTHAPGSSYPSPDGCNTCTCNADGSSQCTLLACFDGCLDTSGPHAVGDVWAEGDGCNTCSCGDGGAISCSHQTCVGSCTWQGQTHQPGDQFPAGDGCNTCSCDPDGTVSCTLIACASCTYEGVTYAPGASFPALDGCNTCNCEGGGTVSCTEVACACDPTKEWWRHYVATSPAACMTIDYACTGTTIAFENDCGCGCAQDPSCPQSFDCMPPNPCDVPTLMAQCPYSTIAY